MIVECEQLLPCTTQFLRIGDNPLCDPLTTDHAPATAEVEPDFKDREWQDLGTASKAESSTVDESPALKLNETTGTIVVDQTFPKAAQNSEVFDCESALVFPLAPEISDEVALFDRSVTSDVAREDENRHLLPFKYRRGC